MQRRHHSDEGFSVIEIIIAMTLLALMSIAMVPLMLTAIQASVQNRSQVAATTYANAELAALRRSFSNDDANSCGVVATRAHGDQPDPSGSKLVSSVTVGTCPTGASAYPATVTVTITVSTSTSPAQKLTVLNSEILVSAP